MLIPFQDVLKPYANLKLQHRGLVVKNDDPLKLGRIKCKVQGLIEASDIDRLPWCYPKETTSRGGRSDSGSTAVPPVNSMVIIEFPAAGDSPTGGGNPYYPVWVGMSRMNPSNPGIATESRYTEDSGLSTPYGGGTTNAHDIETNIWVKSQSQNVSWMRVDKNRGSVEFFDQDSNATIRIDRGGHVQLQITSLDVVTSQDVRFKVGGNFHAKVSGKTFFDVGGDIGMKTGANFGINASGNIDDKAGGAIGMEAGSTVGIKAGSDFGVDASSNAAIKSGANSTVEAGGSISLVAGGLVSERGSVCARDAGMITDNGGASQGALSEPPGSLGTNSSVMSGLDSSGSKLSDRAGALDGIVSALKSEADKVKQAGQQVLNKIKDWASQLNGTNI